MVVAELKRQLGPNSKNSSLPLSAEGLGKKPATTRAWSRLHAVKN